MKNKETKMKVGLKLDDQLTVSKHNIVQVVTFENEFHLSLTNGECLVVIREEYFDASRCTTEVEASHIGIPVNEYHRVQRELTEYFGVEIKDISSDPNETAETE